MERDRLWSGWWQGMQAALQGALRLSENEPLTMALAVVGALLPGVYPRASLRGFKALEDALLEAQRSTISPRRERVERRQRLQDRIQRTAVWMGPSDIPQIAMEPPSAAHREIWGIVFTYPYAAEIVQLVEAVLPIVSQPSGGGTLVVPLPGGDAS
jgi:hypothetical protein